MLGKAQMTNSGSKPAFPKLTRNRTFSREWKIDAIGPKPTSRNTKILAAKSVPLRTNLEPKPKALARLWGLAQVAKCPRDR